MKEEHEIRIIVDDAGLWCKWSKNGKIKTYSFMGDSGEDYSAFMSRITKLASTGLDSDEHNG